MQTDSFHMNSNYHRHWLSYLNARERSKQALHNSQFSISLFSPSLLTFLFSCLLFFWPADGRGVGERVPVPSPPPRAPCATDQNRCVTGRVPSILKLLKAENGVHFFFFFCLPGAELLCLSGEVHVHPVHSPSLRPWNHDLSAEVSEGTI